MRVPKAWKKVKMGTLPKVLWAAAAALTAWLKNLWEQYQLISAWGTEHVL